MSDPSINPLEQAVQEALARDIPLGDRLAHVADRLREINPVFAEAVDHFVERLERAGAGKEAPKVGEPMPGFMLPDDEGRLVSLERLLEKSPVAIAFHRGHWCPYCRLSAAGLVEVEQDIRPVQIVAISAETQAHTRRIKSEAGAGFPFLTDFANGYALSLNLAIWVDDAMASLMAAGGIDVPRYQGVDGWLLPIPSLFVVGQDGIIVSRHVDPDFRHRMELDALRIAALAATRQA